MFFRDLSQESKVESQELEVKSLESRVGSWILEVKSRKQEVFLDKLIHDFDNSIS